MSAREELFGFVAAGAEEADLPTFAAALDAYRAEVLRDAADAAHDEGDRLYDNVGIEHAEIAWGVASKLRRIARKGGAK